MSHPKFADSILYKNADFTAIVIDIPRSIAAAQGTADCPVGDVMLSSPALETPYEILNEPRTMKSQQQLQGNTVDSALHESYCALIQAALRNVRDHSKAEWCLPRKLSRTASSRASSAAPDSRSRLTTPEPRRMTSADHLRAPSIPQIDHTDPESLLAKLSSYDPTQMASFPPTMQVTVPHRSAGASSPVVANEEPWEPAIHNSRKIPMTLIVRDHSSLGSTQSVAEHHFRLPPLSTFILDNFSDPHTFRNSIRALSQSHDLPRTFDFVLLDPPWPNRSARRKKAYTIQPTLKDTRRMLLQLDLDSILTRSGIIAVWITNKPALREMIVGPGGLFEQLNVSLKEEWIWIKTTTKGEPIFSMDSALKKPYEVLLLAQAPENAWTKANVSTEVARRVIAAVPDLHSRKPCLKSLVEQVVFPSKKYTALEVFARHLVADWWSWGNEVLKFNAEGCWAGYV